MADILIRGMEMPTCCDQCFALDDDGDYPMCRITHETRGYNFRVRELRMDKCPFVEIKTPHGRLIDADKLIAQLKRYTWNMDADDAGYAMAIHDLLQDIDSQDTVQPTVNQWIPVKERVSNDAKED